MITVSASALLLSCAVAVWRIGVAAERMPALLDARVAEEASAARAELRALVERESELWRDSLRSELVISRRVVMSEIRAARADLARLADQRTAALLALVDGQTEKITLAASTAIADATESVRNTADAYAELARSADRAIELVTPQALGTIAAAKVTAGQLAKTARTWERASPAIAENLRQTSEHAKQTTSAARIIPWAIVGAIASALAALASQ